jgi:hypothetical protein
MAFLLTDVAPPGASLVDYSLGRAGRVPGEKERLYG